jgi:hypothetical protein
MPTLRDTRPTLRLSVTAERRSGMFILVPLQGGELTAGLVQQAELIEERELVSHPPNQPTEHSTYTLPIPLTVH